MTAESALPATFWQRRLRPPLLGLFRQGLTPDRVAFTLGVGGACALFPFLGFTSLLNLGVGLWLRLNQPVLQLLNQLLGPLQLALILAYVRAGEWMWRADASHFTLAEITGTFRSGSLREFLERFGWAGIHALTAWIATTPLLIALVYFGTRPALRRLASKLPRQP